MAIRVNKCQCCLTTTGPFTDRTLDEKTGEELLYAAQMKYIFPDFEFNVTNPYMICVACGENVKNIYTFKQDIYKKNVINEPNTRKAAMDDICLCCLSMENIIKLETELIDSLKLYINNLFDENFCHISGIHFKLCIKCYNMLEGFHSIKENVLHANAICKNVELPGVEYKLESEINIKEEYIRNVELNDNNDDEQKVWKSTFKQDAQEQENVFLANAICKNVELPGIEYKLESEIDVKEEYLQNIGLKDNNDDEQKMCKSTFKENVFHANAICNNVELPGIEYKLESEIDIKEEYLQNMELKDNNDDEQKMFKSTFKQDDQERENVFHANAICKNVELPAIEYKLESEIDVKEEYLQNIELEDNNDDEQKMCKSTFKQDDEKQLLLTDTGKKNYDCEHCNKRFTQYGTLKRHLLQHGQLLTKKIKEKKYECTHCKKRFARSGYLKYHLLIHGEKKFECKHCNKLFAQSSSLRNHLLAHSREKNFECGHCSKRFSRLGTLKIHLLTCKEKVECIPCNKRFSRRNTLKINSLTHTRKKYIKCDCCINGFINSKRASKKHLLSRSGKKKI